MGQYCNQVSTVVCLRSYSLVVMLRLKMLGDIEVSAKDLGVVRLPNRNLHEQSPVET